MEPVARLSVKPFPAGTVKPLMFTVVQLEALTASSSDAIVVVQFEAASATDTPVASKVNKACFMV